MIKLEQYIFYQRLIAAPNSSELKTTVRMICKNVDALTTTVSGHFHAYTLHDMTHLWNVIEIMEELIPEHIWETPWKEASDPLGPFQCALCLMAGLVHDIGMAPPAALIDKLKDVENLDNPIPEDADRDFVAYRRRFASCEDDVPVPGGQKILRRLLALDLDLARATFLDLATFLARDRDVGIAIDRNLERVVDLDLQVALAFAGHLVFDLTGDRRP
jgi:hypothetical protein